MSLKIFASDFDGVICDGLIEYLASTEKAYQKIWQSSTSVTNDTIQQNFYRLRPVIETGWEMPVLLRALVLNYDPDNILAAWQDVRDEIVKRDNLDTKKCALALDTSRDNWIDNNLDEWLSLHRFYPGVLDKIQKILDSEILFFIVTTKEGRFVKKLLKQQGIELPEERIIGKESKRPKYETLRKIEQQTGIASDRIWFVEDRIEALQQVKQQPDLKEIKLFLADWGYNTQRELDTAKDDTAINLLSLSQFVRDFDSWLSE